MLRSWFLLVQSTWLIQIGILFFLLGEDEHGLENTLKPRIDIHGRLMNLASGFSLHIFFNFILLLIVSFIGQKRGIFIHKETNQIRSPSFDTLEEEEKFLNK